MCERAETKTSRSMDFKNRKQNATAKFENIKTNTMYGKKINASQIQYIGMGEVIRMI